MYNIIITTQLLNYVSSSYRYSVYADVASIVFFITNYAKKINNNNVRVFSKKGTPLLPNNNGINIYFLSLLIIAYYYIKKN